jgi:DNA-binding response OmpR family regulator
MAYEIMVVDDEVGALTLIGIMLERGGFTVLKARDASMALEALENAVEPDLFILDVMMPGMDGIALCREIRARSRTARTPVIILSARGDADAIEEGFEAGADDYLSKPILHHDLVRKVRETLGIEIEDEFTT